MNWLSTESVEVIAHARLHITLVDMCGELNRLNGSVGLSIAEPKLRMRLSKQPYSAVIKEGDRLSLKSIERVLEGCRRILNISIDRPVSIEVNERIPSHAGLGSGTQTEMAILVGLNQLFKCELSLDEIMRRSSRGRTSGIGIHSVKSGGFLIDGGHPKEEDVPIFLPSRYSKRATIPPLLFQCPFPDEWGVVVYVPNEYRGLSGEDERLFMKENTPIPRSEVANVCHTLMIETMPSLYEKDFPTFGKSIDRLQIQGWKARHWARKELAGLGKAATALSSLGLSGIGLSSTGPTLFAFYRKTQYPEKNTLYDLIQAKLAPFSTGSLFITEGKNNGMCVQGAQQDRQQC